MHTSNEPKYAVSGIRIDIEFIIKHVEEKVFINLTIQFNFDICCLPHSEVFFKS